MIVCKFGGTSVATENGANKIKEILKTNKQRKIVVVSAIGKSEEYKIKVTDLLFKLFVKIEKKEEYITLIDEVFTRYENLSKKLKVKINWTIERQKLIDDIVRNRFNKDYIVSRGEYYSAKLYSKFLNLKFIDAKDCIVFYKNKKINYVKTKQKLCKIFSKYKQFVVGGYYGADSNDNIITFDRGGSDITGAIIAKLLNASIYENYTDVDGVFDKNPNIFSRAKQLPFLNFKTAILMADSGNEIVHKSALMELKNSNTMLIVKNTFNHKSFGTVVVDSENMINDVFVCLNKCYLLKMKKLSCDVERQIKEKAQVQKVFKAGGVYNIIINSLYDDIECFCGLNNFCEMQKVCVVSVFSNLKINSKLKENILKFSKKVKKNLIFGGFLSYFNNYIFIFNECYYNLFINNFNL